MSKERSSQGLGHSESKHEDRILDQFSRQAATFVTVAARSSEASLRDLEDAVAIDSDDAVLDTACGPGIVACHLAQRARHVTGTDVVPAMIERAQRRQSDLGLTNLKWLVADSYALPFPESSFSLVLTRFSFHHLVDRERALREMARVCRVGGRVAVVDVTPEEGKTDAYDKLERLRDPSHASTLSTPALLALSNGDELQHPVLSEHRLEISLDAQLAASFPGEGDSARIRQMVSRDIGTNRLGVNAYELEGEIILRLPVSTVVWQKHVRR